MADTPSNPTSGQAAIDAMPFEQAMAELETIVSKLEKGQVALEESITLYERGEFLKRRCEALLKNAEMRIQKITVGPDGQAKGVTSFEPNA